MSRMPKLVGEVRGFIYVALGVPKPPTTVLLARLLWSTTKTTKDTNRAWLPGRFVAESSMVVEGVRAVTWRVRPVLPPAVDWELK
jgi:hypothetical protein